MGWGGAAWLMAGLCGLAACSQPAQLPLSPGDLETFRRHTSWKPAAGVTLEDGPSLRQATFATSVNVGDIKVIQGDQSNVSVVTNSTGTGLGLRMDDGRQDIPRITSQVIAEEGDRFDFIVVFPTFPDMLNPGLAYFSLVANQASGFGVGTVDLTRAFGSTGRLQGFLNMNRPAAYTDLDGRRISDAQSAAFPIMGQEMAHRWGTFARFSRPDFNDGRPSSILLGRDSSHWSALVHTGPQDLNGANVSCSVMDGVAWRDNLNGTFTAVDVFSDPQFNISPHARYSLLDLYLMGFHARSEVEPFFVIVDARYANQFVPASARIPVGATITGTRMDVTMDMVVEALGPRVPGNAESQHAFTMAVVVLTQPGQNAASVSSLVSEVDAFRVQWEQRFHEWTGERATLCTSLSGECQHAVLTLEDLVLTPQVDDGVLTPGERLTVSAMVHNTGINPSETAAVSLLAGGGPVEAASTSIVLGSVAAGARVPVTFELTPSADFPCGQPLHVALTVTASGSSVSSASVESVVGIRNVNAWTFEDSVGWLANPDALDTATSGAWAPGPGHRTDLGQLGYPDIVCQPGADSDDPGSQAFLTGPGTDTLTPQDWDLTDVDHGFTTLESPPLDLRGLAHPVLEWKQWHVALVVDLVNARVDPALGDDLVLFLSADGAPFVEVDRHAGHVAGWAQRSLDLWQVTGVDVRNAQQLRLRFVVGDGAPEQNLVEAGVDDVRLTSQVPECTDTPATSSSGGVSGSAGGSRSSGPPGGSSSVPAPPDEDPGPPCACTQLQLGPPLAAWAWVLALLRWRRR